MSSAALPYAKPRHSVRQTAKVAEMTGDNPVRNHNADCSRSVPLERNTAQVPSLCSLKFYEGQP